MSKFPVLLSEPLLAKAASLKLFPEDIEESFVRGSGAGGQKINKTSSVVQLRHRPSGLEVRCQRHREQSKNRLSAYKLLILKLEQEKLGAKSLLSQKIFKLQKQKQHRSKKAKEKVLAAKKVRSTIKNSRKAPQNVHAD
jgi:protein subunit release factor B